MTRNLALLDRAVYDLLVIGGGIYGACVAYEASLRGLSVALVEKGDFGSGTSANSLKIIHGGLRYLQQLDIKRLRASTRERTILMNIAPHLVHPLPVVIPTYGHGVGSKGVLFLALLVSHVLSIGCKKTWDPEKTMPWGSLISKAKIRHMLPHIPQDGLTGGALFYDAQVYNSERLVLCFLRSAVNLGAVVANYVEVTDFLKNSKGVAGVIAKDTLTENTLEIRSKMVVNTSGPWIGKVLKALPGAQRRNTPKFAKAINLITRPLSQSFAFGVPADWSCGNDGAAVNGGNRLLFVAPWRGHSLIGTAYTPFDGEPDEFMVTREDIEGLLAVVNQACPSAGFKREDVRFVHGGLLPCADTEGNAGEIQMKTQFRIHDHRMEGIGGIISVIGVKYTTARNVAQKAVDRVFLVRGQRSGPSQSDRIPLSGGEINAIEPYVSGEAEKDSLGLNKAKVRTLIYNYGTAYEKVLQHLDSRLKPGHGRSSDDWELLRAQTRFAIREEMAQKLSDVVFRRTELGSAGHPGNHALEACVEVMSREFGWSHARLAKEMEETQKRFVLAA